jgi:hypothetical protein
MNKSQFYHGCSFLTAGRGERYLLEASLRKRCGIVL